MEYEEVKLRFAIFFAVFIAGAIVIGAFCFNRLLGAL